MVKRMALRKKMGRKRLKAAVVIFILFMACNTLIRSGLPSVLWEMGVSAVKDHTIPIPEEWYLIVVNPWNEIPEDYSVTLTELSNGQKVDSRIYSYLQEMFDAMKAEGIQPVVREGYRTAEEQQEILEDKLFAYVREGYSHKRAEKLAKAWVAVPGTSEHQLGLAVDINADQPRSSNEEVYTWLAENAHSYGFILRYPQQKENVTGTSYEPWHYRYVGKEAAAVIYADQICLEEYMQITH